MNGTQVGPFTIVCPLDDPGPGRTYLAEHTVLKTRRAVKLLEPERMQDALAVRRFLNEARTAAQLHHRNLIGVHDVGQLPDGTWFLVLDHLYGRPLGQLMADCAGPMPAELIVHIVAEIANGLQVAHEHKIVHRDLTPEHVFLIQREADPCHVVLLEVGTARLGDAPTGTAAYLAPEQLRDGKVSAAADVFALGVIAYQMTTGGWFPHQLSSESRASYGELPRAELYHRQLSVPPVDPRERCRDMSRGWAEALLAAVSAEPAQRPESARALALRLAEALPPSADSPGGLVIVRACAHELIDTGAEIDTVRTPRAAVLAAASAAAVRALPATADIGSRYRLGARLGAGGMAEVFSATMSGAEGFARRVAIKRVQSGLSRVPAFAAMFIAEARIASRLSHPNIVSVLDFARDADDRLYLVMEYVDGKDLASLLAAGPVGPAIAVFVTIELLRALGYAHDAELGDPADPADPAELAAVAGSEGAAGGAVRQAGRVRGVIHRDVSPQNLLISYEGEVKMSDFGLAKVRAASGRVRSDVVRGKPSYMSPEQVSGEPLDGRSDLYAAGVMLWEMLADRPLFSGTAKEITAQVLFRPIARPSQFRPVPGDLEAVAMTLLAHDRADRYPTARAAIDALFACADAPRDGRGELARLLTARFRNAAARGVAPRSARAQQVTVESPPSVPAVRAATCPVPRPRARRYTATLGVIATAGLAAAVLARGETAQPPTGALRHAAAAPRAIAAIAPDAGPDAGPAERIETRLDSGSEAGVEPSLEAEIEPALAHAASATPAHPAPRRERTVRTGELAIIVRPWAVIWLNGKPSGQTPFRSEVPAGRYRVRLANDNVGRDETTTVTVEPDRTATVERSW